MHRPPYVDLAEKRKIEAETARKKGGGGTFLGKTSAEVVKNAQVGYIIAPSSNDLKPTAFSFHPSMTTFGVQPSLVVGTACGTVVKWNMIQNDAAEKNLSARKSHLSSEKIIHGAPFLEMEPADVSSSGYDENSGTYLTQVDASRGGTVKREFFEYHKTQILFVGFVENASLEMVVVDEENILTKWNYEPAKFSGHCWFRPTKKSR